PASLIQHSRDGGDRGTRNPYPKVSSAFQAVPSPAEYNLHRWRNLAVTIRSPEGPNGLANRAKPRLVQIPEWSGKRDLNPHGISPGGFKPPTSAVSSSPVIGTDPGS